MHTNNALLHVITHRHRALERHRTCRSSTNQRIEDARLGDSIAVSGCCLTALARTSVVRAVTSSPRKTMLPEVTSYSGLALRTHVNDHDRFMPTCKNSKTFCSIHSNKVRDERKIKGTENIQLRRRKAPQSWNSKGTKDAARKIAPVKEAENVQLRRIKLPSPETQKEQRMLRRDRMLPASMTRCASSNS